MSDPFIGQISMFGFNFAPRRWGMCAGSLVSIQSNNALYSVIGTNFGGDGVTSFGLPDIRGRIPVGSGQGPGLSNWLVGEWRGAETHTLTTFELPAHTHEVVASQQTGDSLSPNQTLQADVTDFAPPNRYKENPTTFVMMNDDVVEDSGGSNGAALEHANMMPSLGITWCIAMEGTYPPRD